MKPVSLIDLFENMDKQQLAIECQKIFERTVMFPWKSYRYLEDTRDIEVVAMLIESMMVRMDDVEDQLMDVYYKKTNDIVMAYHNGNVRLFAIKIDAVSIE